MGPIGNVGSIVLLIIATILFMGFSFLWIMGSKFNYMVENLPSKHYLLKTLYTFGFELLSIINYKYKGKYDRKMIGYCKIIFGKKYAEYYYRINLSQQITFGTLIVMITCILGVIMNDWIIILLGILSLVGIVYYFNVVITEKITFRTDSILCSFSEVLSKLALLVNAGMIINEAWEKVAITGEGVLYEEMRLAVEEMRNGTSEFDAYMNFSQRCSNPEVTKFTSTLVQNLQKGNKELVEFLKQFSNESWTEKKHYALRKGEEASGKLLIPIAIMFLGLMLMIMIPMMSNMSM